MLDWLIVGGGVHGCTLATYLIKSGKTTIEKLAIIDPHDEPLTHWKQYTNKIGMEFLRSPGVHHIDINHNSLQDYAKKTYTKKDYQSAFLGFYRRPSLSLFNEHSEKLIDETNIKKCWYKDRVNKVDKKNQYWHVHTTNKQNFFTKNLVLCMSITEQLHLPEWAKILKEEAPEQVFHIFDKNLTNIESLKPPIAILGGGITAAHLAIKAGTLFPGKITLIKRHPFRIHAYDSEPGWLGPKYLDAFHKIKDVSQRRHIITKARHKGSVTKELNTKLNKLKKCGELSIIDDEVIAGSTTKTHMLNLYLSLHGIVQANSIILTTGFDQTFPREEWLQKLIKDQNLSCANCGFPIVSPTLEWCPHLFVTGALAELEIGPVSRNIAGARKAAQRIVFKRR